MLQLNSVTLNQRMLKDFYWQLDEHPLTIVRGWNKDKGTSGNTVGKSFIWACIASAILGTTPYIGDKKTSKLLFAKNSSTEIDLSVNNVNYKLLQAFTTKEKIDLFRNGKSIIPHTKQKAKEVVTQTIGWSEERFYSQLYISSFRPSLLLYGTTAQRYDYFENIFNMQIYDAVNKLANKKLNEINAYNIDLEYSKEQYNLVAQTIDPSACVAKVKLLGTKLKKISKSVNKLNALISKVANNEAILKQIKTDQTVEELDKKQETLIVEQVTYKIKYKTAMKQLRAYHNYKSDKKRQVELKTLLADKLEYKDEDKIRAKIDIVRAAKAFKHKYKKYFNDLKLASKLKVPFDLDYSKLKNQVFALQTQLDKFNSVKDGICFECGQQVSKQHIKIHKKQLKAELVTLQANLNTARLQKIYNTLHEKYELYEPHFKSSVEKLATKLENTIKQNLLYNKQKELAKQVKKLESVEKPNISKIKQKFYKIKAQVETIKKQKELKEQLDSSCLEYSLSSLEQKRNKLQKRFLSLNSKQQELSAKTIKMQINWKSKLDYEEKIINLTKKTKYKLSYEYISKLYSSKGMRIQQITMLAHAYVENLNKMSTYIYTEPVKFSINIDSNNFHILLFRSGQLGDIRSLSGSESRQFLALSAVAFSLLLPLEQRCSHIVFDEVESGMSDQEVELYSKKFIPEVCKLFKHVIVITPLNKKRIHFIGGIEKVIVKYKNISRWQ